MNLTVGSLFSGIGGLDLGLERAGWDVRWQAENDDYCSRVLKKHWPEVPNLGDVTTVDWSDVERVDLICGGYPCQPFSLAGSRRGTDDERHLWPHMRDAIGVLRPRLALLENVPGHLSLGFDRVLGDLVDLGYDAEWDCIPAASVGAPHLRYRVFIVAHAGSEQHESRGSAVGRSGTALVLTDPDGGRQQERAQLDSEPPEIPSDGSARGRHTDGLRDALAYAESGRRQDQREPQRAAPPYAGTERNSSSLADSEVFGEWPGLCPRCAGGLRGRRPGDIGCEEHAWATEPDVGRVAHGVPSRVDRLRALGNAVVPQVAEFIGRRLLESTLR